MSLRLREPITEKDSCCVGPSTDSTGIHEPTKCHCRSARVSFSLESSLPMFSVHGLTMIEKRPLPIKND